MITKEEYMRGSGIFYAISREDYNRISALVWEWKVFYGRVNIEEPSIDQLIEFFIKVKGW